MRNFNRTPVLKWAAIAFMGLTALTGAACKQQHIRDNSCGIGIAQPGDGQEMLLRRALHNANAVAYNFDDAVIDTERVDPEVQPNDRIKVIVENGNITSVESITEIVSSCAELDQLNNRPSPTSIPSPLLVGTQR